MRKVYICSPYRAADSAQLDRNIDYAQALTKQAIEAGLAPITPHLYMTQCLNEDKPEERAAGMAAGLTLLKSCDFVIVGVKYGISEGMSAEIAEADAAGIEVVNADKLRYKLEHDRRSTYSTAGRGWKSTQSCTPASFAGAAGYTLAQATVASSPTERLTSMRRNFLQVDKVKSPLRYGNTLEG